MHLVLMTRGINRQVEEWKSVMEAARFVWKRKNLTTGKEELNLLQGSLRPIQIWEYVFPEESLNDVLGGMLIKGNIQRPEIKTQAWLLRKMLKLEPIPEMKENAFVTGYRPEGTLNGEPMPFQAVHNLFVPGVAVYPVGIKKDIKQDADWGENGKYEQEMI